MSETIEERYKKQLGEWRKLPYLEYRELTQQLIDDLMAERESLRNRDRIIYFMASSLLEQAETSEPVINGEAVFDTLRALAAKHDQNADEAYWDGIAETLDSMARSDSASEGAAHREEDPSCAYCGYKEFECQNCAGEFPPKE